MQRSPRALRVSIVIPVYNEEDYLRACLDTVAAQSVPPDEVIVVDNNSTDGSTSIARQYSFVTVITEHQQGTLYARTRGFDYATGDVIGRIDADTVLAHDWVARLHHDFRATELAAVTGPCYYRDMPFARGNIIFEHLAKSFLYKHAHHFPFLLGANMAIRRSAWQSIRLQLCHDPYCFEDTDIAIHLFLQQHRLYYDRYLQVGLSARRYNDKPRAFYRYIRLNSLMYRRHNLRSIGSFITITSYLAGYILLWPLYKSYDPRTKRRSVRHLLGGGTKPRPQPM